ncbi:hypothetical protein FM102_00080 [Corynebacterium glutamicum]|nr:hypothetical protein FM102_00080 [Corynebacterium glutamicum]
MGVGEIGLGHWGGFLVGSSLLGGGLAPSGRQMEKFCCAKGFS